MESLTQIRRSSGETDIHGLPVWVDTNIELFGIVSARTSSTLTEADAVTITQGLALYLASDTDVVDNDRFIIRGKLYIIDGEAFDWKNGLGSWSPGVVVNLKREANAE